MVLRVTIQWQKKSLNFVYGYSGEGPKENNPKFEITANYPSMDLYYGALAGLAYSLPSSICTLGAGALSEKLSQKTILAGVIAMAGLTQLSSGLFNSMGVFALMRVVHAMIYAVADPLIFSMVGQYFSSHSRGSANALLQSANFIGISMSSLSIILINNLGWRAQYLVSGLIALGTGLVTFLFVRDPRSYNNTHSTQETRTNKSKLSPSRPRRKGSNLRA